MGMHVFKLPDIGEGVVEGEVVQWHVSVGDAVKEDDPIVDVMTDKAAVTIPSPVSGVVSSLNGGVGDMIAVGSALVEFDSDDTPPDTEPVAAAEPEVEAASEPEPEPEPEPASEPDPEPAPTPATPSSRALASPALRRRAREAGIDIAQISGSGPSGRIRNADLDAFIAADGSVTGTEPASQSAERTDITEVKVVGLRRKIAEQMTTSKTRIAHFSYFEEADVTELETLRRTLNASRDVTQPKLTYLPFIMLALSKIMPDHPECNAIYDDQAGVVMRHGAVHIGIATQTERGLYVPVVKHVEAMDAWQAAEEMQRVAGAARDGTASLDDLTGSTFTITSLGRDGGLGATPIINHPEVAILGVHKAREMPVARDGQIVVRRIMNLSSSFDHRVVDGADGAALIQHLKRMLENPALIFM
uniref:Dihydrolipoamide acetyltransferase (BkdB) n=1 Tax=uncultured marine group II/III euryarchaeote KM3_77_D02 TaxID=1456509 RepID=A0A075HSF9_9EURY|nr:dihydrolipoamide acetyltransferase (bkdB) [uncultured marine group II/III euryarchaeote KM3_77_D02]